METIYYQGRTMIKKAVRDRGLERRLRLKSTCSCRGCGFGSQDSQGGSQIIVTPVPECLLPSSVFSGDCMHAVCIHTCRQNKYIPGRPCCKKKNLRKIIKIHILILKTIITISKNSSESWCKAQLYSYDTCTE